jgi:penicillin-binding protein 1A
VRLRTTWSRIIRGLILIVLWGILLCGLTIGWFFFSLPHPDSAARSPRTPSITILGKSGSIIGSYGNLYGPKVDFEDVPPSLLHAIIATEDRRFFEHVGVDLKGILRAAWINIREGKIRQGGSTLTQQIAKNLFLTQERSLKRKIQEALLALWLEAKYTKKQLFTIYLNRMYFGSGTYGVSAAAWRYFALPVSELDLRQVSVIAGLLKAPTRYSPFQDKNASLKRGNLVLSNMVASNFISTADSVYARAKPLRLAPRAGPNIRYFTDWVVDRVAGFLGNADRDLIVQTTLDMRFHLVAEKILQEHLGTRARKRGADQAALVALDRNGAIRAMIGGVNYQSSQFNRVTQARRQSGSAFKLFVYLAGLEAGMSPEDTIDDSPIDLGGWRPKNYDGRFRGEVSLSEALSLSLNVAAVRLSEKVGRKNIVDLAERLGITTRLRTNPSFALGTDEVNLLELTSAYAVLGNDGFAVWPYGISEIRDTSGKLLYRRTGESGRLLSRPVVEKMQSMLENVVETGTGRAAKLTLSAAGKTGTSQDFRDAWFIGIANGLTTGVWVGNDAAKPMKRVTGGSIPAQIWRGFMGSTLNK